MFICNYLLNSLLNHKEVIGISIISYIGPILISTDKVLRYLEVEAKAFLREASPQMKP